MSKTIPVISESGRLTDSAGAEKESDSRYSRFSRRILGDDGTYSTLDGSWNGKTRLSVGANGTSLSEIRLYAAATNVTGSLTVGGTDLQTIIDNSTDVAFKDAFSGTEEQIKVTVERAAELVKGSPRYLVTIGFDESFSTWKSQVSSLLDTIIKYGYVIEAGDGLEIVSGELSRKLNIVAGEGLKIAEDNSLTLDYDETPTIDSRKPVTSDGVARAIASGGTDVDAKLEKKLDKNGDRLNASGAPVVEKIYAQSVKVIDTEKPNDDSVTASIDVVPTGEEGTEPPMIAFSIGDVESEEEVAAVTSVLTPDGSAVQTEKTAVERFATKEEMALRPLMTSSLGDGVWVFTDSATDAATQEY